MTEWITASHACVILGHLDLPEARKELIKRAGEGKMQASALFYQRTIEDDPNGARLDNYIKLVSESAPGTFPPMMPNHNAGVWEDRNCLLAPGFFHPAFGANSERELDGAVFNADWLASDFSRVEMIGPNGMRYDRLTQKVTGLRFERQAVQALVPPSSGTPSQPRRGRGPEPKYDRDVAIGALLSYANLDGLPDGRGAQEKMLATVLDAYAALGQAPGKEIIRRDLVRWLRQMKWFEENVRPHNPPKA